MRLYGKLIKETKIIKETFVEQADENAPFRDQLEDCLIRLCRELDVPVPMWLSKNTKDFGKHHWTFFTKEHFVEKVKFDRFEIRIEQI